MRNTRISLTAAALLATLAGLCQSVAAQEERVAPQAISSPQPPQPVDAAGNPVEGWVTLRYSVLADGAPANIRAINAMPPTIDPAETIDTFGGWTFSPATEDGEAIDWHNNETVVVFRLPADNLESSIEFQDGYTSIAAMIDDEQFEAAANASEELLQEHARLLPEIGLALAQRAIIRFQSLDLHAALEPLRLATDPRVPILNGPDLFTALQLRMQIELELGRARDGLATYNRLASGLGEDVPDPFSQAGEQLLALIEDQQFIEVAGRLEDGSWRIDAGRPFFYVDNIEGEIESIDLECDMRRLSLEFSSENDYQLPASFGDCVVFLNGESGTTFSFIEVAPETE